MESGINILKSQQLLEMKNHRSNEHLKGTQQDKNGRFVPAERKTYSPTQQNYSNLARKAKEQLKDFENKRKVSPQVNRMTMPIEEGAERGGGRNQYDNKTGSYQKTLQHTYSHKVFKKEHLNDGLKPTGKEEKGRPGQYEYKRQEKLSADFKAESPKKKHYIDSNEYKKLHEKLDIIETKITDMKKNLQKKKQEKQRNRDNKTKTEKEAEYSQKSGLKDLVTKVAEHRDLTTFHSNPYSPRHNVYYVSELVRAYKDEQSLAKEHLLNSLNILKMLEKSKQMNEDELRNNKVNLPRKKGHEDRKTIVFDLDETLIHCNDTLNPPYDVKIPIKFPTGETIQAGINIRPYSKQILKNLSKHFQIVLFTASHACYGNVVVDYLDPNRQWVHHRLFRQNCYLSPQGMYIKDLRVINRNLKDMVLVDNAAYSYAYQLENGIPIFPYYHGQIDFELKMLEDYVMKLLMCKDVREVNERTFKLTKYRNYYAKPEKLVEDLYINQ